MADDYSTALGGWPWYEVIAGAFIVTATAVFTASGMSHMVAAWISRTELNVAVRSPRLGILSGAVAALVGSVSLFRVTLFPAQAGEMLQGTIVEVFSLPLVFSCFTCAYGCRGIRLIIMYDPQRRRRWGLIIKESVMFRGLVGVFVAIQVISWSIGLVYGTDRIKSVAYVVSMSGSAFTIAICFGLVTTLRKTKDIFGLSLELQRVGALALVFLVIGYPLRYVPPGHQRYYLIVCLVLRYLSALWFTNIQPIRAVLREKPDYRGGGIKSLFPYLPLAPSMKVVAGAGMRRSNPTRSRKTTSPMLGFSLEHIMQFPPLLNAFEDYCQKALCIESLQFLVEAEDFRKSFAASAESNDTTTFATFVGITDKYIKDSSHFEVNIDSKTKMEILAKAHEAAFKELSLDQRSHILDEASKEIAKMLNDNLYHKFRATEQYKQIAGLLISPVVSEGAK